MRESSELPTEDKDFWPLPKRENQNIQAIDFFFEITFIKAQNQARGELLFSIVPR
jgi:hypothetical protein